MKAKQIEKLLSESWIIEKTTGIEKPILCYHKTVEGEKIAARILFLSYGKFIKIAGDFKDGDKQRFVDADTLTLQKEEKI